MVEQLARIVRVHKAEDAKVDAVSNTPTEPGRTHTHTASSFRSGGGGRGARTRRVGGGGALLGEVAEARVKVGAEGFERVLELEGGVDAGGAGVHAGELAGAAVCHSGREKNLLRELLRAMLSSALLSAPAAQIPATAAPSPPRSWLADDPPFTFAFDVVVLTSTSTALLRLVLASVAVARRPGGARGARVDRPAGAEGARRGRAAAAEGGRQTAAARRLRRERHLRRDARGARAVPPVAPAPRARLRAPPGDARGVAHGTLARGAHPRARGRRRGAPPHRAARNARRAPLRAFSPLRRDCARSGAARRGAVGGARARADGVAAADPRRLVPGADHDREDRLPAAAAAAEDERPTCTRSWGRTGLCCRRTIGTRYWR